MRTLMCSVKLSVRTVIPMLVFLQVVGVSQTPAIAQSASSAASPEMPETPAPSATEVSPAQEWETIPGISVSIDSLKRTAHGTTTLIWSYMNTSSAPVTIDDTWTKLNRSVNGRDLVSLVDLDHKKVYYPMTVSAKALGRVAPDSIDLAPGQKYTTWIKFAALPAEVKNIDISIEGVAVPFEAFPVTQ